MGNEKSSDDHADLQRAKQSNINQVKHCKVYFCVLTWRENGVKGWRIEMNVTVRYRSRGATPEQSEQHTVRVFTPNNECFI